MTMAGHTPERIRWRLFLTFVAISLVLLLLETTGYLSAVAGYLRIPLSAAQSLVTGRVRGIQSAVVTPRERAALRAENEELRQRVAELERRNEELVELQAEYAVLSTLLDYAKENPEYRRVAADVVGWDTSNFVRTLIINRGERDGLGEGMPVETERGLVGRLVAVFPHSAQVQLLTDPGSSINARLGASRADGVVQGQLTSHLKMKWIEQDIPVGENELVMTSGVGGNLPPDLVIGRVTRVEQSASELFQEAEVRPAVDSSRLEIVLIITDFEPVAPEQPEDRE